MKREPSWFLLFA